jgi:hypothetical protein
MTQPPSPNGRTIAMELKVIRRAMLRILKHQGNEKAKSLALRELRSHVLEVTQDY